MAAPIPRIRTGDTRRFSVTYSDAPSRPIFSVYVGSGAGTLVYSTACTSVTALVWEAYYRPDSADLFAYTFTASYTAGQVIDPTPPGLFQCVRVTPG